MSRRRPMVALVIALMTGATMTGCTGAAPAPQSRDEGTTRVAFYGDSYTLGTGASDPSLRWSTIICEQRGWSEFNPSVNGLGFVSNRTSYGSDDLPAAIIADDPDIVFVTMGLNDNFSYGHAADEIQAQVAEDLDRLASELPGAHVVVVEPFWHTDGRPDSVEAIIGWVRDAAGDIGADYIPGASYWIAGHPEWMAVDGVHPNDAGYAELARRMDQELREIGL